MTSTELAIHIIDHMDKAGYNQADRWNNIIDMDIYIVHWNGYKFVVYAQHTILVSVDKEYLFFFKYLKASLLKG